MALKPISRHLTKRGHQPTSKPDPDSVLVNTLARCMKSDFGSAFIRQYQTPNEVFDFKNRLATKLMGFDDCQVLEGYDRYTCQTPAPTFPPSIPELIAFIRGAPAPTPAPQPVPQLERIKSDDPNEIIDCRTEANKEFNKACDDEERPEFKVKDSYSRAEILALRETYHEKLGMN